MNELLFKATALAAGYATLVFIVKCLPSRRGQVETNKSFEDAINNKVNNALGDTFSIPKERVQVVVLGDIGRSPRMQYHAISLAKRGVPVDLIGYRESDLHPEILSSNLITIHAIPQPPKFLQTSNRFLFLIFAPIKVMIQICSLWIILGYRVEPALWMMVQNPPSIPILAIAELICFLRLTHLIIDWHNFGYSILALKLGDDHLLVRISRLYERTLARFAVYHFTVTNAMTKVLEKDFGIRLVLPLHDRPHTQFQPLEPSQRFAFLAGLPETRSHLSNLKTGKTRLLVSSTSWTPDEDFSILLSALTTYSDVAASTKPKLPELLVIITGKGPQKDQYIKEIALLKESGKLEMVTIETAWLSTEDYAQLLGAADLGVSLHTSSSGVDLPMKVVDMFGAGLPVVAWRFKALKELVKDGVNGESFGSAGELASTLVDLLHGDNDGKKLRRLREGALKEGERRWDDEWKETAGEVFGELLG